MKILRENAYSYVFQIMGQGPQQGLGLWIYNKESSIQAYAKHCL